jgi:hypothetical protein
MPLPPLAVIARSEATWQSMEIATPGDAGLAMTIHVDDRREA